MYLDQGRIKNFVSRMTPAFESTIEAGMKELLERKHLYQHLDLQWPSFAEILKQIKDHQGPIDDWKQAFKITRDVDWIFHERTESLDRARDSSAQNLQVSIHAYLPTIKIYCDICENVEAHNPVGVTDIFSNFEQYESERPSQLFLMIYWCQGCKNQKIVFLVRRDRIKVSINGRTPIETVIVPSSFPREFRKYISGAVVAFQSGQVLSANFMLRTLIEQYVRSKSKNPNSDDLSPLWEEYQASLYPVVRDEMPSLRAIYERLSVDIHSASGSSDEYEMSRSELKSHFDGKRLFDKVKGRKDPK